MKGKKFTPEQIIRTLREGEDLIAEPSEAKSVSILKESSYSRLI